ncbi:MAG: acyltransferase family protein [Nitrososphaerales archaeon]
MTSRQELHPPERTSKIPPVLKKFDPGLSGLRGIASFGVVLFHASSYIRMPLFALTSTFYLGVPVFLMMSMYLLLKRLDANKDLKHYFKRRIIRIWPIYFGTLVVFYFLFPYPLVDFVRYLFFVEYYVNPFGYFPVSIFWTLQLEEAAYLFIPLIHKMKHKEWLGSALIISGFAYLSMIAFTPLGHQPMVYLQIFLPVPLIAYGFGILAYAGKIPRIMKPISLGGILGYALLNYLATQNVKIAFLENYFLTHVALYSLVLIGFAAVIVHPPKFLGWFAILGEESYALYAVHYAFVMIFGLPGILYSVVTALAIEFVLRPKEIMSRLRASYSAMFADFGSRLASLGTKVSARRSDLATVSSP